MVKALIAAKPDRILWGSNWPHPGARTGVCDNRPYAVARHRRRSGPQSAAGLGTRCGRPQSLLKRGLIGTYHHVGSQRLQRYVTEFDFRYNNRDTSDTDRVTTALRGISGKKLIYRDS